MESINFTPFWHKASFDEFIQTRLPQLLAGRLPLAGYGCATIDQWRCQVTVAIQAKNNIVEVTFPNLPQPDATGRFLIDGLARVVVPRAVQGNLAVTQIDCVGELLFEFVAERLGEAPPDLPWDETLVRAWLPLDRWLAEFMASHRLAQALDETNWLAEQTHLRRVSVTIPSGQLAENQLGRVCLFEQPEGPNFGRILTLTLGATINECRLVAAAGEPIQQLGLSAAMIPCLAHDDPFHLQMGANMLRQWLPYADPEPALVQSGYEPGVVGFWCGRNLLTAFIPWGAETTDDAILLSESGARRLSDTHHIVEPGDKLSNRHGTKGVISRIVPDAQMPRLPDGSSVELLFSGGGQQQRMNFGQVREAILGRIAHTMGDPLLAPPFAGPDDAELLRLLAIAALSADGQEMLLMAGSQEPLPQRVTVGWVYWGRTAHLACDKLYALADGEGQGQRLGPADFAVLRSLGAFATIREHLLVCAIDPEREESGHGKLSRQLSSGQPIEAEPSTPIFARLYRRLQAAGIAVEQDSAGLRFSLRSPANALKLAAPLTHPWLPGHSLSELGIDEAIASAASLVETNARLARLRANRAPASLLHLAETDLAARVESYLAELVPPQALYFAGRTYFSGRAVLAPGSDLCHDQVGLPEAIAWTLFTPLVVYAVGAQAAAERTPEAFAALDRLLASHWVIVHRSPSFSATAFLAFHPVRESSCVLRLSPLVCRLLEADYDGDQASILLPITAAGQTEAGRLLSVAAHLDRDAQLIEKMLPRHDALVGLANLSRTSTGRDAIRQTTGHPIPTEQDFITHATLAVDLHALLHGEGVAAALNAIENLWVLALHAATGTGVSLGAQLRIDWVNSSLPGAADDDRWRLYTQQQLEQLTAVSVDDNTLGQSVLTVKSGARGNFNGLIRLLGPIGPVQDLDGQTIAVLHGYRAGLTSAELFALVAERNAQLLGFTRRWAQAEEAGMGDSSGSFHVLARARRATHPGVVFAYAAATGEIDPLVDIESRLFIGLAG